MEILQVGVGSWGWNWLTVVCPQVEGAQVVGCVDTDQDRLDAVESAGILTSSSCYRSLQVALGETTAEAVLVTTDLPSHAGVVRAALEAGKHVLVEKPFAPSVEEARQLAALADERGLTLMVSQNYRFFPAVRLVRELVAERRFGQVRHVQLDFRRFSGPRPEGGPRGHLAWRQPLLQDMAVHHFDLLRATLGCEAKSVSCRTWNPSWSWFADDPEGCATVAFDGGVAVSYSGSWLSPDKTAWAGQWRMAVDEGELWWTSRGDADALGEESVRFCDRTGTWSELSTSKSGPSGRAGSLSELLEAIGSRRVPECNAWDNVGTLELVEAAVASAAEGGREVPVRDEPAGST
ncbi:MAG: Gfo/Idh/MocA family oxidoreductase [Actinomycetota bacterium]|nr:Gfo/Idh/MocA family oxidoreductase [Actinomycetota bacterium]